MSKYPLNFCGLSTEYGRASTVVQPIPFDKTSTWIKGANKGPRAILEASRNLEFYDIETNSEVLKNGIFTARPIHASSSSALIKKTEEAVSRYLKDNKLVVALGGEHSISIGVIKSYARHFENLSILHLDAHMDSRDSYEGSRFNHACVIARIREFTKKIISVGIRRILHQTVTAETIENQAVSEGMNTLRMSGARNVKEGTTSIAEMIRVAYDMDAQAEANKVVGGVQAEEEAQN